VTDVKDAGRGVDFGAAFAVTARAVVSVEMMRGRFVLRSSPAGRQGLGAAVVMPAVHSPSA
jgi:hypothetical protein